MIAVAAAGWDGKNDKIWKVAIDCVMCASDSNSKMFDQFSERNRRNMLENVEKNRIDASGMRLVLITASWLYFPAVLNVN